MIYVIRVDYAEKSLIRVGYCRTTEGWNKLYGQIKNNNPMILVPWVFLRYGEKELDFLKSYLQPHLYLGDFLGDNWYEFSPDIEEFLNELRNNDNKKMC